VTVAGRIDDDSLTKIREGVHLSEGRTSGARILVDRRTHDVSQLTVTISEGMNREIRRVFARVGYKVTDLRRVRIGPLTDRGLKPGRWRELLNREVDELLAGKNYTAAESRTFAPEGPRKRFPKKQGYARDFVKGGKLVPGARREREARSKFGAGPRKPFGGKNSGPRAAGPRYDGPRTDGPQSSGPRAGAPRFGGMRAGSPRTGPARFGGPRTGAPRSGGPRVPGSRPGARRAGGPNVGGPRSGPARFGSGRPGGPGAGGPRGAPRAGPPRGGRGPAPRPGARGPRNGRNDRGGPR
jgi:hypothetical protein